jgi:hypothetical protein
MVTLLPVLLLTLHLAALPVPQLHLIPRMTLDQAPAELLAGAPPSILPAMRPLTLLPAEPAEPARTKATQGYMVAEGAIAIGAGLGGGLLIWVGTWEAAVATLPASAHGTFTESAGYGLLLIEALLEVALVPLISALAVVLFADGLHLTRSVGGAIGGAFLGLVPVLLPPLFLLLPITVPLGAVIGANLFAPPAEPGSSLLSPTARTLVASW